MDAPPPEGQSPETPPVAPLCVSALSSESNLDAAIGDVLDEIDAGLDGDAPDLVFVFATHHYGGELPRLGAELVEGTGTAGLIGCTGAWSIGPGRELEVGAGLSVLAAKLPGTRIALGRVPLPADGGSETLDFPIPLGEDSSVLAFADPFSFPTTAWLRAWSESEHARVPLVGGLAAGGVAPGQNVLFAGSEPYTDGAVAVVIEGATRVVPVVSQGCRPVGPPLVVTKAEGSVITEIRGEPAATVLMEVLGDLEPDDRALFERTALVGRATDAARSELRPRDLIVRPVMGLDPKARAVAIADDGLRTGATIRLMVRDAESATTELDEALGVATLEAAGEAFGGILVTCSGRGRGLFERDHADALAFEKHLGKGFPIAGMAASGEIGPVGGIPFLHGYTATGALLAPR